MEKRGLYLFFIVTLFLILIPLVNSQQPIQTQINVNTEIGLDIVFPKINPLKLNEDFNFNIQVYNRSNSIELNNITTNCSFHLINSSGHHIFISDPLPYNNDHDHWEVNVKSGNFSQSGRMSYLVDCVHSSLSSGFASSDFEVTITGDALETSNSIVYLILSINALFLFLLCLFGGIALPFKSERNDEGKIVAVQKLKYFKVGLIFLSYVLFVWLLNLLFALSNNFSIISQYTAFFEIIFVVVNAFSFPLFVLMLIIMSILAWKDLKLKKLLLKGINPD